MAAVGHNRPALQLQSERKRRPLVTGDCFTVGWKAQHYDDHKKALISHR